MLLLRLVRFSGMLLRNLDATVKLLNIYSLLRRKNLSQTVVTARRRPSYRGFCHLEDSRPPYRSLKNDVQLIQ